MTPATQALELISYIYLPIDAGPKNEHVGQSMGRAPRWTDDPARAELRAIYAEADAILAPFGCALSGECCDFANTGREPTPTAVEIAEVLHAARAIGGIKKRRSLPVAGSRVCALLGDDGRCRIYASRPFGCRTFFCDRITGPGKVPRDEIQRLSRKLAELSERAFRRDPRARPLSSALAEPLEALLSRAR